MSAARAGAPLKVPLPEASLRPQEAAVPSTRNQALYSPPARHQGSCRQAGVYALHLPACSQLSIDKIMSLQQERRVPC